MKRLARGEYSQVIFHAQFTVNSLTNSNKFVELFAGNKFCPSGKWVLLVHTIGPRDRSQLFQGNNSTYAHSSLRKRSSHRLVVIATPKPSLLSNCLWFYGFCMEKKIFEICFYKVGFNPHASFFIGFTVDTQTVENAPFQWNSERRFIEYTNKNKTLRSHMK